MKEFYLNDKPSLYSDKQINGYVREMKLNSVVRIHTHDVFTGGSIDYDKYLEEKLLHQMSESVREKMKYSSWDSPVTGRTVQGEALVMTYQELYKLLGRFGIYVKMEAPRD